MSSQVPKVFEGFRGKWLHSQRSTWLAVKYMKSSGRFGKQHVRKGGMKLTYGFCAHGRSQDDGSWSKPITTVL